MLKPSATAVWKKSLQEGSGTLTTESQILSDAPYSFMTRFENQKGGTNPEELIAAAHAGCFSMALALELQKLDLTPGSIETHAQVSLEKIQQTWNITTVQLSVSAQIPGATELQLVQSAESAKKNCPVSRLLNAAISVSTQLLTEI